MAERDQIGGALGGHDAGEPGHAEDVALLIVPAVTSARVSGRIVHGPWRWRGARFPAWPTTSTMRGLALGVEMGEARPSGRRGSSIQARAARSRRVAAGDVGLAHQRLADQEGGRPDTVPCGPDPPAS